MTIAGLLFPPSQNTLSFYSTRNLRTKWQMRSSATTEPHFLLIPIEIFVVLLTNGTCVREVGKMTRKSPRYKTADD